LAKTIKAQKGEAEDRKEGSRGDDRERRPCPVENQSGGGFGGKKYQERKARKVGEEGLDGFNPEKAAQGEVQARPGGRTGVGSLRGT